MARKTVEIEEEIRHVEEIVLADETVMDEGVSTVNTLSHKNLADQETINKIKALPKGDRTIEAIGAIYGTVTGLSIRFSPFSDKPAMGFKGLFEGVKINDTTIIRSTACFLPSTIHDTLVAAVTRGHEDDLPKDVAPKRGQKFDIPDMNVIEFTVEIGIQHSDTEVGYSYVTKLHGTDAFRESNPFVKHRAYIPWLAKRTRHGQVPGPRATPLPAPSKPSQTRVVTEAISEHVEIMGEPGDVAKVKAGLSKSISKQAIAKGRKGRSAA